MKSMKFSVIAGVFGLLLTAGAWAAEPFMTLCLDVSNLVSVVDEQRAAQAEAEAAELEELKKEGFDVSELEPEEGDEAPDQAEVVFTVIKTIGVLRAYVLAFPDDELGVAPVVVLDGAPRATVAAMLDSGAGMMAGAVKRLGPGRYRIVTPEPGEEGDGDEEDEPQTPPFDLVLLDKQVVVGPSSMMKGVSDAGISSLLKTPSSQTAMDLMRDQDLVSLGICIAKDVGEKAEKALADGMAQLGDAGPVAAMAGMGESIMSDVMESLAKLEKIGVRFGFGENGRRDIEYCQWYRDKAEAVKAAEELKKGSASEDAEGMVAAILEALEVDEVESDVKVKGTRLSVRAGWSPEDDEEALGPLVGAFFSMAMGDGVTVEPLDDDTPIVSHYTTAPKRSAAKVPTAAELSRELSIKIFPQHFWGSGDEPSMTLECDALAIANADLGKMTYEVLDVKAADGTSLLRKTDDSSREMDLGRPEFCWIRLPLQSGVKGEQLDKAHVKFTLEAPSSFAKFTFTTNDVNKRMEKDGVKIKLQRMERDSVSLECKGVSDLHMFARDETGQYLKRSSWGKAGQSSFSSFYGYVHTLEVIAVTATAEVAAEVEVDLLKGKGMELPKDPTTDLRTRYVKDMVDVKAFPKAELDGLTVEWKDTDQMNGDLICKVGGRYKVEYDWRSLYFGKDKPLFLKGNGGQGGDLYFMTHDDDDIKVHAVKGELELTAPGQVQVLEYTKTSDGVAATQSSKSGVEVKVTFNKNQVDVVGPDERIIEVEAIDATGGVLKKERLQLYNGVRTYFFWGQPERFKVHVADVQLNRKLAFELKRDGLDEAAWATFKRDMAVLTPVAERLRNVAEIVSRQNYRYGDGTLAGCYYLHGRDKKPQKLVDEVVAHSDPAGSERYGYQVKPVDGYYFRLAKGQSRDGENTDYRTGSARKYQWAGGEFEQASLNEQPIVMAVPAEKGKPTLIYTWSQVRLAFLPEDAGPYVPRSSFADGWKAWDELPSMGE